MENGIPIAGASFSVVQGKTGLSTTATIAPVQNGSVVTQTPGPSVVTPQGVTPGVSVAPVTAGTPVFQAPGNVPVSRPTNAVKGIPVLAPQGKVPMTHPQHASVPILPGGKPVMKEVNYLRVSYLFFLLLFVIFSLCPGDCLVT